MATDITKDNTFKIRIDPVTMKMLEKARNFVDLDKSKFIRMSIREKAETILAEHEQTVFSAQDWHAFFDMMDNPLKSTDRMAKAAKKFKAIENSQ